MDEATGVRAVLMRLLRLCPDGKRHVWAWLVEGDVGWMRCIRCKTERIIR